MINGHMMSEKPGVYKAGTPKQRLRSSIRSIEKCIADRSHGYDPPDPDVIRFLFDKFDWSQRFVASMLRVNVSTVRRWTANNKLDQFQSIPFAQWSLILIIAGELDGLSKHIPADDLVEGRYKAR